MLNFTEFKEITFSCKIMLQSIWKVQGPLISPLDIIRHVPLQHVTCGGSFEGATMQKMHVTVGVWHKRLSFCDVML